MKELAIDMTEFGPVIDAEDGLDECLDNLERLLVEVYKRNAQERLGTKFLVTKSFINYKKALPDRQETTVKKTLGFLLKYYAGWSHAPKNGFVFEEALQKLEDRAAADEHRWKNYKP